MQTDTTSKSDESPSTLRRTGALILGAGSLGLFALVARGVVDVADTYGNAVGGGWALLWILIGAFASFMGAGAVALWRPGRPHAATNALFWIVGIAIVVYGVLSFLVGP